MAGRTAGGWTWDYESWDVLSGSPDSLARASGALIILPIALSIRAGARLLAGETSWAAASLVQEVVMFTEATGTGSCPTPLLRRDLRGRESEKHAELIEAGIEEFRAGGEDLG